MASGSCKSKAIVLCLSNQCDVKESYELLDKLSQNNSLEMLATGYNLYHDYQVKAKERGVYIRNEDVDDNWSQPEVLVQQISDLPEAFVDQMADLHLSFVPERFGSETHDTPDADVVLKGKEHVDEAAEMIGLDLSFRQHQFLFTILLMLIPLMPI